MKFQRTHWNVAMVKAQVYRNIIFCILFLAVFVSNAQTRSATIQIIEGKKYYIHKIVKGQSLYSISKVYNVSLEDIYDVNPELKTAGAKADQEIKIPFAASVKNEAVVGNSDYAIADVQIDTSKYITHKILKGETVYSITRFFNITEKQLAAYNPGITPALKEGQIIIVGEKNKKKNSVKKKEPQPVVQEPIALPKTNGISTIDSSNFIPVSKPKKDKYNVALILPFRFEQTLNLDVNELVKTNTSFPIVPAVSVDFYLGFKRAVDSLIDKNFDVNILLYESDDKDSVKLDRIINDQEFKELDLIFGPLYASEFKTISEKAKDFKIPIVSPITQQNKILYNNIYISKTNPSQFTLMESLADYCIDSLVTNNTNIILMLLAEKDKKESAFVHAFKKYYNEKQKLSGKGLRDTVTLARGIAGLKAAFQPNVRNVVVTLSANEVFMVDFTTQLAMFADKKDIVLCGWQSLTETDNIDQEYLNQLSYVFPYQFNITNLPMYNAVSRSYIEQQQTTPGEYFYRGFDIAHYYLSHLKSTGPDFIHELNHLPLETNYTRFKYARPDNTTGFDNRGVFIFRYANYQLQKTGWK